MPFLLSSCLKVFKVWLPSMEYSNIKHSCPFCKYVPIKEFHLQEIHGKDSDKYRFLVTDCTAELNE